MADHVLDKRTREALLGLAPFSVDSTVDYTPKEYLRKQLTKKGKELEIFLIPEQFQPVFQIRCFTMAEKKPMKEILTAIIDELKTKKLEDDDGESDEMARKVVLGWKNLFDAGTMREIKFQKSENDQGPDLNLFLSIPARIRGAILFEASRISGLLALDKVGLKP